MPAQISKFQYKFLQKVIIEILSYKGKKSVLVDTFPYRYGTYLSLQIFHYRGPGTNFLEPNMKLKKSNTPLPHSGLKMKKKYYNKNVYTSGFARFITSNSNINVFWNFFFILDPQALSEPLHSEKKVDILAFWKKIVRLS